MVAYSILGGIDDYQGLRQRPGVGMLARYKIWYQVAIALVRGRAVVLAGE